MPGRKEDENMDLYAPTYILEEFGPGNLLSALKSECEHINHLPVRAIDFHVKFSDNQDFNAVAYEMGDSAYTNVSIATVMQLYHHVLLLMGRSELLPQVGEEGPYEGIYRIEHFVTPEICQYDNRYKQIAFYIGPEDPERLKIAELITIFGMEFILFHELGHHVGGHLKFLERKMGVLQLYAQGNSFALDPQSYQMLETDADAIASACLLESISTKIDFYIKSFLNGSGELLPHCIMIALTTVFFLMDREDAAYDINNSRYIPRDVRFRLVVHIIQDKLKTDYQSCAFSQTSDKLMDTFRVCNSLLDELYTEKDPKKKIVLDEFDEMREYYNNILLPLWKKLRIELEKYAVINLPT